MIIVADEWKLLKAPDSTGKQVFTKSHKVLVRKGMKISEDYMLERNGELLDGEELPENTKKHGYLIVKDEKATKKFQQENTEWRDKQTEKSKESKKTANDAIIEIANAIKDKGKEGKTENKKTE